MRITENIIEISSIPSLRIIENIIEISSIPSLRIIEKYNRVLKHTLPEDNRNIIELSSRSPLRI